MKKDPDVIIADEICRFCKEQNFGKEQLLAGIVRLAIITLVTLDSTELSGEIAGHFIEMKLTENHDVEH